MAKEWYNQALWKTKQMNVTTNAVWLPWWWYHWPRGWAFLPRDTGKNARQNFFFKGAKNFLYQHNDHKTIFAHDRGDMYCIKSHIHFQVSPSTSEIFNQSFEIGRFYPGLPYMPITFSSPRAQPEVVLFLMSHESPYFSHYHPKISPSNSL